MWCIFVDFWDDWEKLEYNFDLFNVWLLFICLNYWLDVDMIFLGYILFNNCFYGLDWMLNFIILEYYILMIFWSIVRLFLMIGGDFLSLFKEIIWFF